MIDYKRVFIDTAPIIYYLENNPLYVDSIKTFFVKCMKEGIQIVTSTITIEEYLVFPYNSGQYKNFKSMDALQIATAIISGCDMFFTNDKQLRQEKELPCITMEDFA